MPFLSVRPVTQPHTIITQIFKLLEMQPKTFKARQCAEGNCETISSARSQL